MNHVCELLPRLPSRAWLVPMKLKRKLCYKGHYMYEYVRPAKIMVALEWLKANNPLYADVDVNLSWEEDAAQDDSELWEAVSSQQRPQQEQTTSHGDGEDMELSDTTTQVHELELAETISQVEEIEPTEPIDQVHEMEAEAIAVNALMEVEVSAVGASVLDDGMSDLALSRGYVVKDVPHNGNCLFSAVQYQLVNAGVEFEENTLREQLVEYFEDHPYAHDGCTHLRTFIAAARDPSVPVPTADTELADDEDAFIELVEDTDTRLQPRWCKYLERMRSTAWGDHVAVQGLADLLQVDIDILATRDPNMEPVKSRHRPAKAVLHLGLIG